MKLSIPKINKVKTITDLENLGIGSVYCDISERGGGLGFYSSDVANTVGVRESDIPRKFGAGCNYLGGGVRGAIFASDFNSAVTGRKRQLLEAIAEACKRAYENAEGSMNDDEDEDGEPNWEASATKCARENGTISAY